MARTTAINLNWARAGLDVQVKMFRKKAPRIYAQMAEVMPKKEIFIRIASMGDFMPADAINQATGITYDDLSFPFQMDVNMIKYGVGFAVASEVLEVDKYGAFKPRAAMMGRSIEKAYEADIANFMNLATAGNITTPDGVTLASTAHLLENGFFSNILSTSAPLTAASLEQAINELTSQPGYTGDPMMFTGPYTLWVSTALRGLAQRLVKTRNGGLAETNNNDKNWGGDQISKIVTNPYFTNPFAWALVVDEDEFKPFHVYELRKLKMANQYDMDKDVEKFAATAIWCKAAVNAAGFIYSPGL
jgi:hypothetical protein